MHGMGCGASEWERRAILVHQVRVEQQVRWRPRDQVPHPTGFRRLRPCRDESGRNVASRLTQPTQVDSVPLLADTLVDTQVNESSPIGFAADAVPGTVPASSGAVRRLELVGAQVPAEVPPVHGRRVVLMPEPAGTPQSIQDMVVEDDSDVEFVATISQFDMTVADSEDGDLHSSPKVSPRHRLFGHSDTESLADGASTVSIHSVVVEESPVDVVHDIRGDSVAIRKAFLSLDAVDLHTIFAKRAAVMKAIPRFSRGSFRNAMRVAMDEALQTNEVRRTLGWKLFVVALARTRWQHFNKQVGATV